ncbi:hypothetical protein ETAA8_26600 [Anatilimnocola aggregata]|uniref:Biotin-protein ligase N-terminal domain-containing protein n=1 Tax=Anatilimnocola aggregata TaxID=2528021 RepID=A0A517YBS5_9BACT|nr:BPL-N domain-containing protein [Anatilimnocola aggregata]QDU27572.1 hypothetical protein ETAA8_26600 [Anatilimnocola aggregata]
MMRNFTLFFILLLPSLLAAGEPLKLAIFDDNSYSRSREKLIAALERSKDFEFQKITAEQIRAGELKQPFAVLIAPGGSSSWQGNVLGEDGRAKVKQFVKDGGGYVGICAGAYLATCDYKWSLHILNAKVIDKQHWARGIADLEVSLPEPGKQLLGESKDRLTLHYHQGPLLAPAENKELPAYQELARFETEVAKNGAPMGVMVGTSAIVSAEYGAGRVLCYSPHPEMTEGQDALLYAGIRWSTGTKK